MTSLKKLAIHGAVWTIAGYGVNQILRFASNLILTRLLVPEFFGLMAVVNTLQMGLELFSDIGVGQSIIQNKRADDPAFLNTAWTINVIRGLVIWLISLLLAFLSAHFYKSDELLWVIPIASIGAIFNGFSSTSLYTLNRQLALGKIIVFELMVQVIAMSGMIIWAYFNPSLLALALGGVGGPFFRMIGSHWLLSSSPNRFQWDKKSINDILSFGKWIFVATSFMFLAEQADRLILGKLLSFETLGVYTIAYTFANLPREIIKQLSYKVIFPIVSKQVDLPRSILRSKILYQRRLILIGFAILVAALVSFGDLFIIILYDKRYTEASWMMPILCFGIWFSILFYTINPALLAIGKPLYSAQSNLARFVTISLGIFLGFYLYGTLGAIIAIVISDLPLYIVNLYGLWQEKFFCLIQDIQYTTFFLMLLTLFLLIRIYLEPELPTHAIIQKLSIFIFD